MGIKSDYEQAQRDYTYLVSHHDAEPNDMTGGFDDGEYYKMLLKSPSKKTACKHYISLITYTVSAGFEDDSKQDNNANKPPDFEDKKTLEIYRRYCLEDSILSNWGIDISEN